MRGVIVVRLASWAVVLGVGLGSIACVSDPGASMTNTSESSADTSTQTESASGSGNPSDTGDPGEFVSLIDHAAWVPLDAVADPFADHRPTTVDCGAAGWTVVDDTLDVDTNFCNYLGLAQPSLAAITEGRRVQVLLYHFDLVAPEPAQAHAAVLVDGQVLWEETVEIPGDAKVFDLEFEAPFSAPIGSEVVFHLHNHGQNSWVLQALYSET